MSRRTFRDRTIALVHSCSLDRRARQFGLARQHHQRVLQRVPRRRDAGRVGMRFVVAAKSAEQRARDAELSVGMHPRIVVGVDLSDQRLEAGLETERVDMRRPIGMAALRLQQPADDAVGRDRVAGRLDGAEPDLATRVGGEGAAQVHVDLAFVLVFVEAVGVGVPDVDGDAGDRRAAAIGDGERHEHRRAGRRRAHDRAAVLGLRRLQPPERAEQVLRRFGGAVGAVVQQADERRDAERAGHQHEFVVAVVGERAHLGEQRGGVAEFVLGEPRLAHEGVQVGGECRHDFAQPRIGRTRHRRDDIGGQFVGAIGDHGRPRSAAWCARIAGIGRRIKADRHAVAQPTRVYCGSSSVTRPSSAMWPMPFDSCLR